MQSSIRAFIAIQLTKEIKKSLAEIQGELKAISGVKWVDPDGIHITLKFLAEVNIDKLESIFKVTQTAISQYHPFTISLMNLGAFPRIEYPKVIWVGIEKGNSQLIQLASEIDLNLTKIGFQREKRDFTPHLTLGRVKDLKDKDKLSSLISKIDASFIGEMEVERVHIMRSQLTQRGAIYTSLKELPLKEI